MTAEIVIMNKEAVAIAADSAVSLVTGPADSPQKIFTSASKIFGLSNPHTVSLMIYNNASFIGIPWDPLLARFEESIGPAPLPALADYADRFIAFLREEKDLITPEIEKEYFTTVIYSYYLTFRLIFQQGASQLMQLQGAVSEDQIAEFVASKIAEAHAGLMSSGYIAGADDSRVKELTTAYEETITKAISNVFEQMPITDEARVQLRELPVLFFVRNAGLQDPASQNYSGIVITGFGRQEIFPSLVTNR